MLHSKIDQERHQPITCEFIVIKRLNALDTATIILPRRKVGTEQQDILRPNQLGKDWHDLVRFEIGDHSEKRKNACCSRRNLWLDEPEQVCRELQISHNGR